MYQETETVQTRRRQIDSAIQLAMDNRWEEAVQVNRAILSVFPNDTDSYNRLGKALMELGLLPGTIVRLIRRVDVGGVLEVEVRGCRLSVRHGEAHQVMVDAQG